MSLLRLTSATKGTVWMTESGYPAIITNADTSKIYGLVISPSGTENCVWNMNGINDSDLPTFYNIKHSPDKIEHRFAVIRSGSLMACCNSFEEAKDIAITNKAEIFSKFSELTNFVDMSNE
ncbi:MAG: hypothetical protein KIC48_12525 [Citrobacter sp.]|uniref:hypothetical protein n=1 Tax=unclassified Citrobacter TaxID=2644389 RepID=UPI001901A03D|nr:MULTISPECIES: hypothetical protein [unclassified Citrobacter]MBJ9110498.1 hypothetical protein [Citrobacter sp. FDAARGOS_156]MBS6003322.1 hypothetical protein [Citrobacter sp.]